MKDIKNINDKNKEIKKLDVNELGEVSGGIKDGRELYSEDLKKFLKYGVPIKPPKKADKDEKDKTDEELKVQPLYDIEINPIKE